MTKSLMSRGWFQLSVFEKKIGLLICELCMSRQSTFCDFSACINNALQIDS